MKDNDKYMAALAFYAGADNHYGAGFDQDGKISNIEWNENNPKPKPTTAQLDAIIVSTQYSHQRKDEYPSVVDQLDDIYHNGLDAWKATIKVTKDKYPK